MANNEFKFDITAKSPGTTNIIVKAQAENGDEVTKTIAVTVKAKPIEENVDPASAV